MPVTIVTDTISCLIGRFSVGELDGYAAIAPRQPVGRPPRKINRRTVLYLINPINKVFNYGNSFFANCINLLPLYGCMGGRYNFFTECMRCDEIIYSDVFF